jgi:hypothetical protein
VEANAQIEPTSGVQPKCHCDKIRLQADNGFFVSPDVNGLLSVAAGAEASAGSAAGVAAVVAVVCAAPRANVL